MEPVPLGLVVTVTLLVIAAGLLVTVFEGSPFLIAIAFMIGVAIVVEYYIRSKDRPQ